VVRKLEQETWVSAPFEEVFAFFSRAENLESLTPASLAFHILTPLPISMGEGVLIDYRIRLGLVSFKWRTLIREWDPPHGFVDEQLQGPYRKWVHEHTFVADGEGTRIVDQVEYEVPGWVIEPLIHRFFVRPQIERIFAFRAEAIRKKFGLGQGVDRR